MLVNRDYWNVIGGAPTKEAASLIVCAACLEPSNSVYPMTMTTKAEREGGMTSR